MRTSERVLSILLIAAAAVTAFYWWSYFTGGDVRVLTTRWYTAFEDSFPVADGWMAVCALIAGLGFLRRRSSGPRFGLMAGSALIYLAGMDITFNVENGLYSALGRSGAMRFEASINAATLLLGLAALAVSWRALSGEQIESGDE